MRRGGKNGGVVLGSAVRSKGDLREVLAKDRVSDLANRIVFVERDDEGWTDVLGCGTTRLALID